MKHEFYTQFADFLKWAFATYGELVFGILVGLVVGWGYNFLIANRFLRRSYEERINNLEQHNNELRYIVFNRLKGFTVEKKDKEFFRRLKKFFWRTTPPKGND